MVGVLLLGFRVGTGSPGLPVPPVVANVHPVVGLGRLRHGVVIVPPVGWPSSLRRLVLRVPRRSSCTA
eukprot:217742-Heterocapsa_arctica.AAC.1